MDAETLKQSQRALPTRKQQPGANERHLEEGNVATKSPTLDYHTLRAKLRNYIFPLVQGHSIDALKCENIGQAG